MEEEMTEQSDSTGRVIDGPGSPADGDVPHSARMYDYWLGGKDNYAADRAMAEAFLQRIPTLRSMARENRDFVGRATRFLAEQGIEQFLDIGTGIPTSPNLHETAQGINPSARVVYVDNDPVVLAHARALMMTADRSSTAFVDADLRSPETVLTAPEMLSVLDLDRPVALMMIAVLMLIDEDDDPYAKVAGLREAMPSGSYFALTHPTGEFNPDAMGSATAAARAAGMTFEPRNREQVARLLGDWEPVPPGIVPVRAWRPDAEPDDPESAYYWAVVARKP
jgi:hypothetical protein